MSKRKLTNRLRITNGISFVIILILLVKIVDLSDKNNRLEEKSKKEVMKNAEIVDQYFDLQFRPKYWNYLHACSS